MRARYRRYDDQLRPTTVAAAGGLRGLQVSEAYFDEVMGATSGRLKMRRPAIDPHQAGQDLDDAVTDVENHLDSLREAGLAAVSEPIAVLLEDLRAAADYSRTVLDDYSALYQHADELTGDLNEAQRVQSHMAVEQDRLARQVETCKALAEAHVDRAKFAEALQTVLYQAEKRGTIGRGTVKRWLTAARDLIER